MQGRGTWRHKIKQTSPPTTAAFGMEASPALSPTASRSDRRQERPFWPRSPGEIWMWRLGAFKVSLGAIPYVAVIALSGLASQFLLWRMLK